MLKDNFGIPNIIVRSPFSCSNNGDLQPTMTFRMLSFLREQVLKSHYVVRTNHGVYCS